MSDTSTEHLGPKPEPAAEPPELFPGGTDAVDDPERYHAVDPAVRDLDPRHDPAAEDTPDELTEPEDKQQEPDEDSGTPTDEHGETEPPA